MKRFYTLLFNITLISSLGVAKSEKINVKQKAEKSAKVRSSKLVDYKIKRGDTLYSVAKRHHSTVSKIMLINGMKSSEHLVIGQTLKVPTETVEYARTNQASTPQAVAPKAPGKDVTAAGNKKVAAVNTPGQTAEKSTPPKVKKAPTNKKLIHTVVKGDTLSKIAKNNHITIGALRKANRLKVKEHIILGQKLIIPRAKKSKNKVSKPRTEVENTKSAAKLATAKKESASQIKTYEIKKGDSLYRIAINHHTTIDALKRANKIKSEKSLKLGQLLTIPVSGSMAGSAEPKTKVSKAEPKKEIEKTKMVSAPKSSKDKVLTHTVKKGDSLYRIAKNNHITVDALKKANQIKSEKSLRLGQLLTIPTSAVESKKTETKLAQAEPGKSKKKTKIASAQKPQKTKMLTHTVKKGDSLYLIAKNNHTTVDILKKANKLKSGKSLKLGQLINIPAPVSENKKREIKIVKAKSKQSRGKAKVASAEKTAGGKARTHTVKKGDLLYTIAKNNHVTVEALKKANKIKSAKSLKPGQILTIPGAADNTPAVVKLAKSEKKKEYTKIAKAKTEKKKSVKVAKAKTKAKKKTKIATAKQSKKSFLEQLTGSSKSPLKLSAAKKQLGKRYVWGAEGPYSFDCSGFTSYVCKKSGVRLPRRSIDQSKVGKRVSRRNLKPGDLVFFDTSRRHRGYVNHVGIYLGNNKFIHASSAKKKVVIASLEKPFYKSRFKWGRRVKVKS